MDAYDCKRFIHGCPDVDYYSDEIHKCKGLNSIILYLPIKLADQLKNWCMLCVKQETVLSFLLHVFLHCIFSDPNCVSIGNGCFHADESCDKSV